MIYKWYPAYFIKRKVLTYSFYDYFRVVNVTITWKVVLLSKVKHLESDASLHIIVEAFAGGINLW